MISDMAIFLYVYLLSLYIFDVAGVYSGLWHFG